MDMNLNRRIESLEKQSPVVEKVYSIRPRPGEIHQDARQRYCQEKNITEADLEAGFVVQRIIVSPGHRNDGNDKPS